MVCCPIQVSFIVNTQCLNTKFKICVQCEHNVACFVLQDALEILAQNADFSEKEGRSIAFRRSASVLKALPHVVHAIDELKDLPCLGEHSLRIIKVRDITG